MNTTGNTPTTADQILQALLVQATFLSHETADLNEQHERVCAYLQTLGFHLYNNNYHTNFMETIGTISWKVQYGEVFNIRVNVRTTKPAFKGTDVTPVQFELSAKLGSDETSKLFAILGRALNGLDPNIFKLQVVNLPSGVPMVQILVEESARFVTVLEFKEAQIQNQLPA